MRGAGCLLPLAVVCVALVAMLLAGCEAVPDEEPCTVRTTSAVTRELINAEKAFEEAYPNADEAVGEQCADQ
jgi:hypothetical protein